MSKIIKNPVTDNVGAGNSQAQFVFTKVVSMREAFYEDVYGYEKEIYYLELESYDQICLLEVLKKLFDKIEYDDSVERALKCFNNIKSQHLNNLYGTWEFEESMCYLVALHDAAKIYGELFIKV